MNKIIFISVGYNVDTNDYELTVGGSTYVVKSSVMCNVEEFLKSTLSLRESE